MLCSCFVKVSIDHLFDNLESGKRNYCFEKGLEIVLNFGSKKSVRTLYKWWLLHEKSYQIGFSSHTRTEWSSAASISIVENHQPSPEAFSARSILDSTVNCDVTQRGWLESHISDSSHYMYIRLLFVSARKLPAIVWTNLSVLQAPLILKRRVSLFPVPDPELEIRVGGRRSSRPLDKKGLGRSPKKFFSALRRVSVWSKNKRGPGLLPWIRHWFHRSLRHFQTLSLSERMTKSCTTCERNPLFECECI